MGKITINGKDLTNGAGLKGIEINGKTLTFSSYPSKFMYYSVNSSVNFTYPIWQATADFNGTLISNQKTSALDNNIQLSSLQVIHTDEEHVEIADHSIFINNKYVDIPLAPNFYINYGIFNGKVVVGNVDKVYYADGTLCKDMNQKNWLFEGTSNNKLIFSDDITQYGKNVLFYDDEGNQINELPYESYFCVIYRGEVYYCNNDSTLHNIVDNSLFYTAPNGVKIYSPYCTSINSIDSLRTLLFGNQNSNHDVMIDVENNKIIPCTQYNSNYSQNFEKQLSTLIKKNNEEYISFYNPQTHNYMMLARLDGSEYGTAFIPDKSGNWYCFPISQLQ